MLKHQDEHQQEQLSAAIDALNCGRRPQATSEEVAALLAVASQVKKVAKPVEPPADLINNIVDTVAGEMERAPSHKRRTWLFSGAVSTAAAVVVLSVLNLWPTLPGQSPAPVMPPVMTAPVSDSAKMGTAATAAPEATEPSVPPATASVPKVPKADSAAKAQQDSIDVSGKISAPAAGETPVAASQPHQAPFIAKALPVSPEKPSSGSEAVAAEKSLKQQHREISAAAPRSAKLNQRVASTPMARLTLPDRQADVVSVEQDGGVIRQIYNQGQADEIIITQRRLGADTDDKQSAVKPYDAVKEQHQVSLKVGDMEVTIAGAQPEGELRKIAQALTPSKQPSRDSQ